MSRTVDCHAHVVSADAHAFPTVTLDQDVRDRILAKPYTVERLLDDMNAGGIDQALLVQRSQIYGFDNSYIHAAAKLSPRRLFAVAAIDVNQPDCIAQALACVADGAVGLRLMRQAHHIGLEWLTGGEASALWGIAAERGLPMCVHFFPSARGEGLMLLRKIVDLYPGLPIIIDHLSNLPLSHDNLGPDPMIAAFSEDANVNLKFTAIPLAKLKRDGISGVMVLQRFIDLFGAERLMWGSDVSQSLGSYAELIALGQEATNLLPLAQRELLLGANAARIYGLPERPAGADDARAEQHPLSAHSR